MNHCDVTNAGESFSSGIRYEWLSYANAATKTKKKGENAVKKMPGAHQIPNRLPKYVQIPPKLAKEPVSKFVPAWAEDPTLLPKKPPTKSETNR